jgi:hypothetical protein
MRTDYLDWRPHAKVNVDNQLKASLRIERAETNEGK